MSDNQRHAFGSNIPKTSNFINDSQGITSHAETKEWETGGPRLKDTTDTPAKIQSQTQPLIYLMKFFRTYVL